VKAREVAKLLPEWCNSFGIFAAAKYKIRSCSQCIAVAEQEAILRDTEKTRQTHDENTRECASVSSIEVGTIHLNTDIFNLARHDGAIKRTQSHCHITLAHTRHNRFLTIFSMLQLYIEEALQCCQLSWPQSRVRMTTILNTLFDHPLNGI
jgi:hypothetical protein